MSSSTSTSLTLRALLKTAANRLGLGCAGQGCQRADPGGEGAVRRRGRAVATASSSSRRPTRTSSSSPRTRASSSPPSKGVSDADAANLVLPFPSHEIDPYRGLSPHFDIASARARTLHALSTGTARLVIASAAALLPRLSAPGAIQGRPASSLRSGDEISPTDLGDRLAEAGYTRQDPTDEPGEFSVRGGVVDFYAAGARHPDPAGVHRRHDRVAPHLRSGHAAIDRRRSIRRTSSRCRSCWIPVSRSSAFRRRSINPIERPRSSTTCPA